VARDDGVGRNQAGRLCQFEMRSGLRADDGAARSASARGSERVDGRRVLPRRRRSDTLLFIDNIFRFTQAGSEVSTLLGRMPSAVGYQPNLATEMGELQERITSTSKGSVTSVQAVYVPADDLTDPAPATTFAHLDATTVLSRPLSNWAFIRLWIRWPRHPAFFPRALWARITTTWHRASRKSSSATRICRTSSRFWASTSFLKTIN